MMRDKIADVLECHEGEWTVYVLADAILAAMPGMIPELVWQNNGNHWAGGYGFVVRQFGGEYTLTIRNQFDQKYPSIEAAKTAANAHHRAAIAKAAGWTT
jgi:hypothetical protein